LRNLLKKDAVGFIVFGAEIFNLCDLTAVILAGFGDFVFYAGN